MNTVTKRILNGLAAMVILALALAAFVPSGNVLAAPNMGRSGPGGVGGTTVIPLTLAEKDALRSAILEEYKAYNLYQAAIKRLGAVYPFSNISRAELQHVSSLASLAAKYGMTVPANPGLSPAPVFANLQAACQAGVAAEIEDAQLYNLLKAITSHKDVLLVYTNLQSASLNNHLPAFQTCD